MQIEDIANQVLDDLEMGRVKSTANYYADNFTFSGPVPMPLNKTQFIDLMAKVITGVPDWNFNRRELRVEGQTVVVPVQVTGTQTQTLPALMPGMPDLPATHRAFRIPPEIIQVKFQGEQIVDIHVDPVPGGGIPGMLEQLGMQIPVTGHPDKPSDQPHPTG